MQSDPAKLLKARLRRDLTAALLARRSGEVRVIRTLIAAIDNAEAVEVAPGDSKYSAQRFGDEQVEVPRRRLSAEELDTIIANERDERLSVAVQQEAAGNASRSSELREESRILQSYLC